jgi:hypothetical protein
MPIPYIVAERIVPKDGTSIQALYKLKHVNLVDPQKT